MTGNEWFRNVAKTSKINQHRSWCINVTPRGNTKLVVNLGKLQRKSK